MEHMTYHCTACHHNIIVPADELPVYECSLCGAGAEHLTEEKKPDPELLDALDDFEPPKFPRRLLVVACSATKDPAFRLLPAICRYQGAYYQVIKSHKGPRPQIVILSALHGFIAERCSILDYNKKMDKTRAKELAEDPQTAGQWEALVTGHYDEVMLCGGAIYRDLMHSFAKGSDIGSIVEVSGGIGQQRSQLKRWLQEYKELHIAWQKGQHEGWKRGLKK